MRRAAALVLAFACVAPPAPAQDAPGPMSAAAFDAYTKGKTFSYEAAGKPYGAEQYLSGHKVIWAFRGQECLFGYWYAAAGGQICFLYQASAPGPQCWVFFPRPGGGLRARFTGDGAGGGASELVAVRPSDRPLDCPGPAVGS